MESGGAWGPALKALTCLLAGLKVKARTSSVAKDSTITRVGVGEGHV